MKNPVWRGRMMMFCLGCMTLMSAGGCSGLSDRQLSSILQTVLSTGLSSLVSALLGGLTGT